MNHIAEVAKLLGLELGEWFAVKGYHKGKLYRIMPIGLMYKFEGQAGFVSAEFFMTLIKGQNQIIKISKEQAETMLKEEQWDGEYKEYYEVD